jgi:hypothetical protein
VSARSISPLALLVAFLAGANALATGPTFNVNSPGDAADAVINGTCETGPGNHACTLRAAVMEANATSGALIVIPAGTHTLSVTPTGADDATTGDLNITSSMTIKGAGVGTTILEAATLGDSAFRIASGGSLVISGLTIQHATGRFNGSETEGGTFYVVAGGTLQVSDARIYLSTVGGDAGHGGALYLASGTATFTRTVFDSCSATGTFDPVGGALLNAGGSLTLDRCTVTGCAATSTGFGGAISTGGTTRIVASTLTNNTAVYGGAIDNAGGTCTLINSTVSGNKSFGDGGGIYARIGGQVRLYNTTVINNRSDANATGSGHGGGIWSPAAASASLQNSVLAYNLSTNMAHALINEDCYGTVAGNLHNLLTFATNCTVTGASSVGDPFLGSDLADNGGPTPTHALAGGGDALDKVPPSDCIDDFAASLTTDQRGVKRPIGSACDLGSFELEPIGDANGDGTVDIADVFYLINYLFAGGPIPVGRADVNGTGPIDLSDVFYVINYLFAGGPAPV